MNRDFWSGKAVFVTGHTGFKGGWLSLWLQEMGARVYGYSLLPPSRPNLFEVADVGRGMQSTIGDIRSLADLRHALVDAQPQIVFHLAAQALVQRSYREPVETYETNVMGSVNLLEAVRSCPTVKAVVIVTSDKCYENREWVWGYREIDPMGGYDPYSSSKGCVELLTAAFRNSYFPPAEYSRHGVAVATARAGNVVGGGDWAQDRLVPDMIRAICAGQPLRVRRPEAIRPWQHVLEPLHGYLSLAEALWQAGASFAGAWNFGPADADAKSVSWLVRSLASLWGAEAKWEIDTDARPHEAGYLKLDSSKAARLLHWKPVLDIESALQWVVDWYKAHRDGANMRQYTAGQIQRFQEKIS
ncbi:MAG TPA: CDP-glucose 4,6-dehydratase [Chthonomonadales bacterium]|nr:CDP-glucose 4,6-dehydratase [Chthonomonadales bacterium]